MRTVRIEHILNKIAIFSALLKYKYFTFHLLSINKSRLSRLLCTFSTVWRTLQLNILCTWWKGFPAWALPLRLLSEKISVFKLTILISHARKLQMKIVSKPLCILSHLMTETPFAIPAGFHVLQVKKFFQPSLRCCADLTSPNPSTKF